MKTTARAATARLQQTAIWALAAGLLIALVMTLWPMNAGAQSGEEPFIIPAPTVDLSAEGTTGTAIFAAGCFWGVQGVFQHTEGVLNAVSGYSGGAAETATYQLTSNGTTGHAETVEITYDPSVITYGELLHILFSVVHNPTQLNYQGPDHGTQYRSTIFVENAEQQAVVEAYLAELDATGVYDAPIVTTIEPFEAFYAAEDYHQDFLTLNPTHPYIVYWDMPKLANFQATFPDFFRQDPALVSEAA